MPETDEGVFWELIEELQLEDARVEEGTIMNGRCARIAGEFLGLVDYKGSGMVVKLPRARVDDLIEQGVGRPFAPAGKVFREWVSIPDRGRRRWRALLRESVAFVAPPEAPSGAVRAQITGRVDGGDGGQWWPMAARCRCSEALGGADGRGQPWPWCRLRRQSLAWSGALSSPQLLVRGRAITWPV